MTQTASPSPLATLLTIATIATLGGGGVGLFLRSQPKVLPQAGLGMLQREQDFPERIWPGDTVDALGNQAESLWFDAPQPSAYGGNGDYDGTESDPNLLAPVSPVPEALATDPWVDLDGPVVDPEFDRAVNPLVDAETEIDFDNRRDNIPPDSSLDRSSESSSPLSPSTGPPGTAGQGSSQGGGQGNGPIPSPNPGQDSDHDAGQGTPSADIIIWGDTLSPEGTGAKDSRKSTPTRVPSGSAPRSESAPSPAPGHPSEDSGIESEGV